MSIKKNLEEKFEKEYNPRAVKVALYYAKKYGLDYGNNSTYNILMLQLLFLLKKEEQLIFLADGIMN